MVELGEVCEVYQAKTITSKEIKESGKYKVYGANGIIGFFDEYNHEDAEIAITCRGATCGTVNFTDPQSWITGNAMVVKPKENTLNKMYLYHLLRSTDLTSVITGAAQPQITASALKPFKIPLPPLEIQEQLVEELDGYAGIITAAKQIAANWKPKIEIDPEWEKVKLGEVCKTSSGGTPSKANPEFWIGEMPWVSSKDMKMDYLIDTEDHISERAIKESATKVVDTGTLLGVVRSGILQHTFPVSLTTRSMSHNQDILAFRPDKSRLNAGYLFYTFKAENKKILCEGIKPGVTVQSFHSDFFKNYKIYLPPLDIQRQIVEKIEAERLLVESAKKLISIYEQKTKDVVTRLWSE